MSMLALEFILMQTSRRLPVVCRTFKRFGDSVTVVFGCIATAWFGLVAVTDERTWLRYCFAQ
jgi:hypothetical protein